LRSGDIWVKGSRRYKNFDDYLIPEKDFDKLTPALPLPVSADYHEYITSRMTLLQSRFEEVNAMAALGELLDRMENGDVLIVTKLDRLGRNAMDIRKTVELLSASEFEKNIRRHSGMG